MLTEEALLEIEFWYSEVLDLAKTISCQMPVGEYVLEHDNVITNGQWSPDKVSKSSTWHELWKVRLVLDFFQDMLKMNEFAGFR